MVGRRDGLPGGLLDQDAVIESVILLIDSVSRHFLVIVFLVITFHVSRGQPALLEGQQAEIPVRLGRAEAGHERQQHDGILKPLGLVDGDDAHQPLITFQSLTEAVTIQRLMAGFQRLMPPAQQRLLAIEALGGILGQLAKVQHVGQGTLAPGARRQPLTDPEVARVGLSETEAREQGMDVEVTTYGIDDLDRAIADSDAHGLVKVLTRRGSDRILGVTIAGPHAGEFIAEYVLAMKHGIGLNKILGTIHIYPTLAEANKFAAGQWKQAHKPEAALRWLQRFHRWMRG